ncbi:hypothetical protein C8Q78DRAFT_372066 [Trametes maxima]|nr:hypothetical protein C8Q78DRAFT_372066 [Trametes maxima]
MSFRLLRALRIPSMMRSSEGVPMLISGNAHGRSPYILHSDVPVGSLVSTPEFLNHILTLHIVCSFIPSLFFGPAGPLPLIYAMVAPDLPDHPRLLGFGTLELVTCAAWSSSWSRPHLSHVQPLKNDDLYTIKFSPVYSHLSVHICQMFWYAALSAVLLVYVRRLRYGHAPDCCSLCCHGGNARLLGYRTRGSWAYLECHHCLNSWGYSSRGGELDTFR